MLNLLGDEGNGKHTLEVLHVCLARGLKRVSQSWLTQVSCVGAHSGGPYKPLIRKGLWAHGCAPLQALIKIKWTFATPSKAYGSDCGMDPWQRETLGLKVGDWIIWM